MEKEANKQKTSKINIIQLQKKTETLKEAIYTEQKKTKRMRKVCQVSSRDTQTIIDMTIENAL